MMPALVFMLPGPSSSVNQSGTLSPVTGHAFDLHGKRAHPAVIAPGTVQALRRKIEFIFRHGFGSAHDFLFQGADLAVHDGSYGWRRRRRLLWRRRGWGAVSLLRQNGHGKNEHCT